METIKFLNSIESSNQVGSAETPQDPPDLRECIERLVEYTLLWKDKE